MTITLSAFCTAIVIVSVLGGILPLAMVLNHTRLQIYLSFSAGTMLGAAFFHMIPEAVRVGSAETVRVVSIVGRFLEHARVYYFRNGGAEEYFIGSADAMKRNLEHRVETLVPVEDAAARQALRAVLDLQLTPNRNAS